VGTDDADIQLDEQPNSQEANETPYLHDDQDDEEYESLPWVDFTSLGSPPPLPFSTEFLSDDDGISNIQSAFASVGPRTPLLSPLSHRFLHSHHLLHEDEHFIKESYSNFGSDDSSMFADLTPLTPPQLDCDPEGGAFKPHAQGTEPWGNGTPAYWKEGRGEKEELYFDLEMERPRSRSWSCGSEMLAEFEAWR